MFFEDCSFYHLLRLLFYRSNIEQLNALKHVQAVEVYENSGYVIQNILLVQIYGTAGIQTLYL